MPQPDRLHFGHEARSSRLARRAFPADPGNPAVLGLSAVRPEVLRPHLSVGLPLRPTLHAVIVISAVTASLTQCNARAMGCK